MSMLPVWELRGSIIVAAGLSIPWYYALAACIIGNMLPIPFILIFIKRIIHWMGKCKIGFLNKIANWLIKKAEKNSSKVMKYSSLGLFLFVAIPLPGTGAWTGSLVAALLDMRMKYALPSIFAGVVGAGIIMTVASYGGVAAFNFLTKI